MTELLCRHYRVVADPFEPPPAGRPAREGHLATERAERELRERLAAGDVPGVLLVSPERAVPAAVRAGGRVTGLFGWTADSSLRGAWTHHPHLTAEVEASDYQPDPASEFYARRGSVLINTGRLRRLVASRWLAPVADQLADTYGVPVEVDPEPELPPAPPITPGAFVSRGVIDDLKIDMLRAASPPELEHERYPGYNPPKIAAEAPPEVWPIVMQALGEAGQALGVPVNCCCGHAVLYYVPGDEFPEHTDRIYAADTLDRTVSFSLLLSEPGVDFEGGQIEVCGNVVELHRGDLLAFTATTRHAVRRVTGGIRHVLVAFGEWRR